jgi:hypothetical protein
MQRDGQARRQQDNKAFSQMIKIKTLELGQRAIDFSLPEAETGEEIRLSDFANKQTAVVLIFFRGLW